MGVRYQLKLDNKKSRLLIEALTHSNWIENEWSTKALIDSIYAFNYLNIFKKLSAEIICDCHEELMKSRDLRSEHIGQFRNCAVRIGNRTCPNVGKEALGRQIKEWIEEFPDKGHDHYEFIKVGHIEFEKIHPFVDGNGRIGRMLMNWQALKAGLDPIVIKVEDRFKYYKWFE
tara:strand:- start:6639 stop:7157 length:519 start_codon:yes stop_codon:yes gene_type:complete